MKFGMFVQGLKRACSLRCIGVLVSAQTVPGFYVIQALRVGGCGAADLRAPADCGAAHAAERRGLARHRCRQPGQEPGCLRLLLGDRCLCIRAEEGSCHTGTQIMQGVLPGVGVHDMSLCVVQAFGAIGAIETAYYRITGKQKLFSEQNLIDCSWDIHDVSCRCACYHSLPGSGASALTSIT